MAKPIHVLRCQIIGERNLVVQLERAVYIIYIYMSRASVTVHMRMRRIYLSEFEA